MLSSCSVNSGDIVDAESGHFSIEDSSGGRVTAAECQLGYQLGNQETFLFLEPNFPIVPIS